MRSDRDERAARAQLAAALGQLDDEHPERLIAAMRRIRATLDEVPQPRPTTIVLRQPQPGDIGWCTYRHGVVYAREYQWDTTFEALVAIILGKFQQSHDPALERGWIAEVAARFAGCVFLMKESERVCRLRCLLVEPEARGRGLGTTLVDACIQFARGAGYDEMVLWTNDVLHAARRIYQRAGFVLVCEERHYSFGQDLCGQTWQLDLAKTA